MNYSQKMKVRMYDTDSAQILFFGNQFRFINDVFEDFLDSLGFGIKGFFTGDWGLVFVHAESDYLKPSRVGDEITISLGISKIGNTSFSVDYTITRDSDKAIVGTSKSTHVTVARKTMEKCELPNDLKERLSAYLIK
jgi:YbgC/YbaW family acyl-CoA thioester hydrolase